MPRPLAVIVLAAGKGTRTKVSLPKVLLPICGKTLLDTVLDTVSALKPKHTVAVLHHQMDRVQKTIEGRDGLLVVDQGEPRGTGHAVQVAMKALDEAAGGEFDGEVLVCYGDMPLVRAETFAMLRASKGACGGAVLTAYMEDPTGLGRAIRDERGELIGIREEKDCSDDERLIDEINVGITCYDASALRPALAQLSDDNAQGELYLTDTVEHLLQAGQVVETATVEDEEEALGVNSLTQLAQARDAMQLRILEHHLAQGVIIEDPATTVIDHGVTIGKDTRILPYTVIRSSVRVGEGCEVGPFTHLRVDTVLENGAEVGNFVEAKKTTIGEGSKAKHLTYLGNTEIGKKSNIGAGTITANYDGKDKHQTVIGDGSFIGSGTVIVAPSTIGDGATIGAGAIVTKKEVPPGEIWVGLPARRHGQKEGVNS
ncbi:MAG: NTP transferase domain-containing protein [Planctomycetota bacterium]